MTWKDFVADYLNFTRKDRIAILTIALIMVLVILVPVFFSNHSFHKPVPSDTSWVASIKKLEKRENENNNQFFSGQSNNEETNSYQYDRSENNYRNPSKIQLFYFDPNTISVEDWKKLGLREKTIQTINNYLNKGGHFNKPEDLQKVYGLHKNEYNRIASYIKIEAKPEAPKKQKDEIETTPSRSFTKILKSIDINTADTAAFISLPGIGSKLASRIIYFRDKLGGFYSVTQIGETFGLPDSTFQKIRQFLKLENTSIRKININTATVDELKAHPYIKYSIANPVIAYRNEHGPFSKVEDIKKIMIITDDIYIKIAPYLTTQ